MGNDRSSTIHLLHEFPYSLIDDEIVFFLFNISAEVVFVIEESRIIDASQFFDVDLFQKSCVLF